MMQFVPTPARAAGLGTVSDRTSPRLAIGSAIAVIAVTYGLFFGRGIVGAIEIYRTTLVLQPIDYGSYEGALEVTGRLTTLAGAVLVLVLVCRWLALPRALSGVPRYPAPADPALATIGAAFIGLVVSGMVLQALTAGSENPNAQGGGVISNGWALLALFGDLNAGVVEEIVIVALPVLVGRRAGWHPLLIVAVSVALRWPFHIYHGLFASLPWTMIWGGANVLAFLYLRRLLPLIAVHAVYDAQIDMRSAYGEAGWWVVVAVAASLVLFLVGRTITGRRRRLRPGARMAGPGVARFVLTHQDRSIYWLAAAAAALVVAYVTVMVAQSPDPTVVWTVPGTLALLLAVIAAQGIVRWRASNAVVHRGLSEDVTAVVRWHTSYTGDNVVDTVIGLSEADAIGEIADHDRRGVVIAGTKKRRRELTQAGIPFTETGFLRRLRIDSGALPRTVLR